MILSRGKYQVFITYLFINEVPLTLFNKIYCMRYCNCANMIKYSVLVNRNLDTEVKKQVLNMNVLINLKSNFYFIINNT